jgi:hypothetical protein
MRLRAAFTVEPHAVRTVYVLSYRGREGGVHRRFSKSKTCDAVTLAMTVGGHLCACEGLSPRLAATSWYRSLSALTDRTV